MATHCGVALKGKACHVIVFKGDGTFQFVAKTKIRLEADEDQSQIVAFSKAIEGFIVDNSIKRLVIKGRAKSGGFSGGAVTFKMEALIQACDKSSSSILSPQTVAAFLKKNPDRYGELGQPAYLREAFDVAYCAIGL